MIYAEKHLSLLSRMGRDGLQLRFTGEFPEEILDQTCKKIEDMGLQEQIRKEEATQIQRELIQVPEFAELYQALCAHGIAVSVIQTMLHAASSYQEHLSQYPKEQVLEAAVLDLKPSLKFEYMKHYQPLVRYEEEEQAVADNLDIVTDEEELIQRFERLVADNKATQAYQDERKVCFPCSECNQWSAASGLCGLTGRYRQPQWECFARYVLPKGKVEGDGANMRIELPIPEKAGKKAVLIDRGQWEV